MKDKGKALAIWGCALHVASVVGVVCYTIGMHRAFVRLVKSGKLHPSGSIGFFLPGQIAFAVVALVGFVLMLVALFGARYRAIWFRNTLWVLSALWLLISPIPIGASLAAICVMVYLVTHNAEFTEQRNAADSR